ncbi:alpha-keto acid decarboxylase family protein [Clostridium folliculivorans]|uniref:alpha-keto acid decarboxylase family protein n=1 Tax=Clostridium folliculivorans TaxID=2886038 RepID=UPI0021C46F23|nr:thiamine pyrophosphate-binding protein [Clostridium folliculivorans]GKU28381.1 pyruvate decarboxylase [Clostridium folliculivorans]
MLQQQKTNYTNEPTVSEYLYDCLYKEGITEIFGVPGDYNFSLLDTLEHYKKINFVNCCNELNSGYAADGYARIKGMGAIITTFGVGELSACNAIAGSYSENVPVIHIVGAPKTTVQLEHKKMHHTLLDGYYDAFIKIYENITAYTAVITKENAEIEIPKAISIAKDTKKPVYLLIAIDVAEQKVTTRSLVTTEKQTDEKSLKSAIDHINLMITKAKNPIIIPDILVLRYGLQSIVEKLVDKMDIPVATMMMGKSSFNESHPNYIGLYAGNWGSNEVQKIVESSDCLITIGAIWSDYNTGSFSANLNPLNIIELQPTYVKVGMSVYENILIRDSLNELLKIAKNKSTPKPNVHFPYTNSVASLEDKISSNFYYPRIQEFIKEDDIIIAETGTFAYGVSQLRLPKGVTYINQSGWGSIGYATPATFGASIAAKNRRIILFTGDGSHQLTTQEISSMLHNNCKPIIFLLNNNFYTIEAYLNKPNKVYYNDIPNWDYTKLVESYGGNSYVTKVYTNIELDEAIKQAEVQCKEKLCFIEMICDKMDAPYMVHNIHDMVKQM